ncbi:PAS/PAC sensor signal transduction histidine kinase [Hyella patelloides LEGE 07179]|uniref:histidine kinase n=1 Tax=Hyella patelloides LEGE 07179 TaxID=945734 RepID=A0A563VSN0_9CYAN|nr:PAS domain-containing sensor histidine kinase [Hyella patelloides]VEP14387.1 PAS/PAC sensor signal transduction histidine kinase [Hyella patelloides LEGE 07179]
MAVSNSKNFKNKALINDRFDLQNCGGEVFEFQTLIENAQVMILIFQDCRICYANPMTKILTGYNQDELLTNTNLRSQLQLHQKCPISDCGNHGATQRQEVRLSTKNGKECWLDCSLRVIQFAKKPAISIVAVDITKHKQAEQKIQQVLEQEKKLVSMVSHELRTPLNVISFSSKLLKNYGDRWKPSKVRKYLERLQRGVDTLSLLIDEWLILGKIDTGKLKFEPKPFNLEQFCDNLLSDLQLGDYHTNLHSNNCKLGERSPRQINFFNQGNDSLVNLDRRILQLILTNLLENAIKYSPEEKEIDFTVACSPKKVIFKIKDRGMGINQSDRPHLFQPFYRGENVDNIPGNGLGLAIVKKLVELSGGQINVESQLGIGTEFVISFPKSE